MGRIPAAMMLIAIVLGLVVTGLFFATDAPPRTAILWGLTSTLLTLLFTQPKAPSQDRYGPGRSGDSLGPVEGRTTPG
jgi:hypothetical protein